MTAPTTDEHARTVVRASLARIAPGPELDALADTDDVRDRLELDSLDFLAFVEHLARSTGIRIDEDDYPRLRTVASAAVFLAAAGPS
ncbi:phosphopantetheine-binding protein [Actinomycetospora chibensis]|uniref:Phosphopantetheine-binding protein n=1 Tax=Actinomycetospora chibensis TaxID=663606 RepID=A0ABV9RN71_9PSEU|nr:phosphopantetheine-binding protein [Actinomycetospora chibensis]MDD7922233.1 phosphopantetheine-binding protein [Actinomycetospora chibensis]